MPKLIRCDFGPEFDRARRELVASARRLIDADPDAFRIAGAALDAEYSVDMVRAELEALPDISSHYDLLTEPRTGPASRARGVPQAPSWAKQSNRSGAAPPRTRPGEPARLEDGDELRGWRLQYAITDFLIANGKGDLVRLLGDSPANNDLNGNARRAILLGLSAVDSEASRYLGQFTTLALAPWHLPHEAAVRIRTRAGICRWFHELGGHKCLLLLQEAISQCARIRADSDHAEQIRGRNAGEPDHGTSFVESSALKADHADEACPPALTPNAVRVLKAMQRADWDRSLSTEMIGQLMPELGQLAPRTIGPIVKTLIALGYAHRPNGARSGAQLTTKGRRRASKFAD